MARLSQKTIEALRTKSAMAERETVAFDDDLPGFGVRVKPNGRATWILQYRNVFGVSHRMGLGNADVVKADAARREAKRLLGLVAAGADPAADKVAARRAPTFNEFLDDFVSRHVSRRKERSIGEYARLIDKHIRPSLGAMKVAAVSRRDVTALHHRLKDTPYQANRALAVLSKAMNVAEAWGLRPDGSNPCRHVEKYPEKKRERFLSSRELAALGQAFAAADGDSAANPFAIAAVRLLIFTGARLNEILMAKWEYVDFEREALCLPDSKTGAKIVQLPPPALDVITSLSRVYANPYLIVGRRDGEHLVNLEKPWRNLRGAATVHLWRASDDSRISALTTALTETLGRVPTEEEVNEAANASGIHLPAGLLNLRLHDLRHAFASIAASSGLSLTIIGALLGHSQPATTARYAHLADDPKKQAAAAIAGQIKAAMAGTKATIKKFGKQT